MRALHLFTPASAGGLESVVQMLLPGLSTRGVATAASAVIGIRQPEPSCIGVLRGAGIRVEVHRLAGRAYRRELDAHRRLIRDFGANVVHTHGYRADVLGGLAAGSRIARVATVHGFTGGGWKNRLYEWLQVRSYRAFDGVVAVSRKLREQLERRGVAPRRLHMIPNAYEPTDLMGRSEARAALGLPGEGTVVGWVGRLSPEKGPDQFLRMARALRTPGVRFVLVGDGPGREGMQALASDLGLADRVHWPGLVPSAGRYYRALDAFVLSSRSEGTPIALFEAMAAQVPIVATAVGGVPDVIDPEVGWLVPPGQPEALAAALESVLTHPAVASGRAAKARARLDHHYALAPWIERYCELYAQVLA